MENFRHETFIQFIRIQKPVWFLKIIWAGAFLVLIILFIQSLRSTQTAFWGYFIFILIALPTQALIFYFVAYNAYSPGKKVLEKVRHKNSVILRDISVFIKGFEPISSKSYFSFDLGKTIYDFDQADLIMIDTGIILFGKARQFGSISYASPVEIIISEKLTSISSAKLLNWTEQQETIVMNIKDDDYNKPFAIVLKDSSHQIKHWLPV